MAQIDGLNERQQAFVDGVLAHGNAAKAYRDAYGRSGPTAEANASRLLRNAKVAKAIESARAALRATEEAKPKGHGITLERWLSELAAIGFSDVMHYDVDPMGGVTPDCDAPEGVTRAIAALKTRTTHFPDGRSHVETEFKLHDKLSALDKIGKHMGFYPKEYNGEGAPNGRQPGMTVRKDGAKTIIDWGEGLRIEL